MRQILLPILLIALALAVPIVPFLGFGPALEAWLESAIERTVDPVFAAALVVGLLGVDVFLPIPSSVLSTLGGEVLGFWGGTAASFAGLSLGAAVGFGLARAAARPLVRRLAQRVNFVDNPRARKLHLTPMPMLGGIAIYLGVMAGLAVFAGSGRLRAGRLPPARVLALLLALGATYAVDGLNSYLSLFEFYAPPYEPRNSLRLVTGLAFGLTMIAVALPVFNATVWRTPASGAPVRSLRELAALIAILAVIAGGVLARVPALLLFFGLISAAGVLVMFVLVGGVLFVTLARRENAAARWRDLAVPALAGLAFAFAITGAIDAARYALTGTWNGFNLWG